MVALKDIAHGALAIGDILRLPENYDLGPGSDPVDLMVFDPQDSECGLGLLVISGYKAGLIYARLPLASLKDGTQSLDTGWLTDNWNRWFCYEHGDGMRVIDIDRVKVLGWDKRIVQELA